MDWVGGIQGPADSKTLLITYFDDGRLASCGVGAVGGDAVDCDSRFKDFMPFCTAPMLDADGESLFLGAVSRPYYNVARVSCNLLGFGRAIVLDHRGVTPSNV